MQNARSYTAQQEAELTIELLHCIRYRVVVLATPWWSQSLCVLTKARLYERHRHRPRLDLNYLEGRRSTDRSQQPAAHSFASTRNSTLHSDAQGLYGEHSPNVRTMWIQPLGGEHGFFHHPTLGQLQVFRVATSFMLQFQALITVRTSRFGDTPTGWRCFRSFMVRKPHRGWLLSCSSSRTRGIHAVASTLYLGSNVNVGSTPSDMEKSRVLFVIL